MGGDAGSTVLEKREGPCEFLGVSELFGVVDQLELSLPLAEVGASIASGRVQLERGVGVLGCELSEEWGEVGRGCIEGMLKGNGDCSKLFMSLRDAGGGGFHELGD